MMKKTNAYNKDHSAAMDKKGNVNNAFSVCFSLLLTIILIFSLLAFPSLAERRDGGERVMLYPGGMPFGIKMQTNGVVIIGISGVNTKDGIVSPGADSGLIAGDVITKVSGKAVSSSESIASIVRASDGDDLVFEIMRGNARLAVKITPVLSADDGVYRTGLYLRDEASGIGTLTFITKDGHTFGGLGHGICDTETGLLLPFGSGKVYDVLLTNVIKGQIGTPGQLRGRLSALSNGNVSGNLRCGIFGKFDDKKIIGEPMPAAFESEVHTGEAYILTTLSTGQIGKYSVNISSIELGEKKDKNFTVTVTDEKLIAKTGGIVQGMSGSPIIQDGRIIGAVTHVLVDNPEGGYGIFIGNMLSNMPKE